MKTVTVTVDWMTGEMEIRTSGYVGKACLEDTRELEAGLGIVEVEHTAEMQQRKGVARVVKQQ